MQYATALITLIIW